MRLTKGLLISFAIVAVALPSALLAQSEKRLERVRTFLVVRLAEALELSDEKALQVSRIMRESDDRRKALQDERRELEKKLRNWLEKGQAGDEAAVGSWIEKVNAIDEQLALLPERNFGRIQEILDLRQRAKLILERREIQNQIRRALERRLGDRRPPKRTVEKQGGNEE